MIKFFVLILTLSKKILTTKSNEDLYEMEKPIKGQFFKRSFSSEKKNSNSSTDQFYPDQSIDEEETIDLNTEEISDTMLDSFLLSRDTENNTSVIGVESSFREVKQTYNLKSNKCKFKTEVRLIKFDMIGHIRIEDKDKDYKGNEVQAGVDLEINEQLIFPNGLVKANKFNEKRLLQSKNIRLKKKGESVIKGRYLINLKKKGIYFREDLNKKKDIGILFERRLTDVESIESMGPSNIMEHYQDSFLSNLKELKDDRAVFQIKEIPCDVALPLTKLIDSYVFIKEKSETVSAGCFRSKTITTNSLEVRFKFEIRFFNKYHIKQGGDYFKNYYLNHKEVYDKFKSIPFKVNIE